jgi:methylthioribose-1-phosphate isomerase
MVGTGTAVVQALASTGHSVHVWVTDAAPTREGARLTALQLAQIDVPHTVIPDTAVARTLAAGSVGAVLLRADTVYPNGDILALVGSLGVAQSAAAAGVPVYALATDTALDPAGDPLASGLVGATVDLVRASLITGGRG